MRFTCLTRRPSELTFRESYSGLLLIPSVSYVRNNFYQSFLLSHIAGWIAFLVGLYYHAPEFTTPYLIFCFVVYGLDVRHLLFSQPRSLGG